MQEDGVSGLFPGTVVYEYNRHGSRLAPVPAAWPTTFPIPVDPRWVPFEYPTRRDALISERDLSDAARELREFAKAGLLARGAAAQARVLEKCRVLRDLPQTRRADTKRPTPKFEYLVQAIVDAVDEIELSGHQSDAAVLRILFGLADNTRRSDWGYRQEQAGRACGVGRDQFRRNLQEPLLLAVAERLFYGTRSRARQGDPVARNDNGQLGHLRAVATQDGFIDDLVRHINDNRPTTAALLELSTATIGPVLEALRDARTETRLLVANPYSSTSSWQQERVWMTLVDRFQRTFVGFRDLEVRMYGVPPGLRGRLIGERVSLGWYTHRDDTRYPVEDPNATLIWGHDNVTVHGDAASGSGAVLAGWFQLEFERLWRHRSTRRGGEVLRMLGLQD